MTAIAYLAAILGACVLAIVVVLGVLFAVVELADWLHSRRDLRGAERDEAELREEGWL